MIRITQENISILEGMFDSINTRNNYYKTNCEDGSILYEYMGSKYRIGFSIEKDNISSWHVVSRKECGSIQAFGYLEAENENQLYRIICAVLEFTSIEDPE